MKPREIPLTQGHVAIVDPIDFRRAMKRKWCALVKKNGDVYGQTRETHGGRSVIVLLHRFLMDAPDESQVDHKDGDGLNCTRENMRLATHGQNIHNQKSRGGSSRFKGVTWHKRSGKWMAQIMCDRKYRYLGLHDSEEFAARAYDDAAHELHGEFARLNFPEASHVPVPEVQHA